MVAIEKNQEPGWLSRSGQFFSCKPLCHMYVAMNVVRKSRIVKLMRDYAKKKDILSEDLAADRFLTDMGWVIVQCAANVPCRFDEHYRFHGQGGMRRLSKKQQQWLMDNGYKINEFDI